MMYDLNNDYLADERINLNIQLDRPILVIGDIERWNGRVPGYKEIQSGNIRDCLYSDTDYSTWYVDRKGDLRCDAIHHDGSNHYLYRAYKPGATEAQIERLKEKIYDGVATPVLILLGLHSVWVTRSERSTDGTSPNRPKRMPMNANTEK